VEANHVIMSEPLLNPAQDAQAISRIHRIGQTKNCYVHRFFMKKSVEEKIQANIRENDIYDDKLSASAAKSEDLFSRELSAELFV
tara:strand:+ start:367 stop:621 length:255 start_codon:yes stop_codon:yes gene_type:complete